MGGFRSLRPEQRIPLAAAHNFTDRVIDTWHARLPRAPRVLVPIQLDALVVRSQGGEWADCQMKTPAPQPPGSAPADARALLPEPFANLPQPRPAGVYLHWALPDALTRGVNTATNTEFPPIPDRWLVVRFYPSSRFTGRRSFRGWVLPAGDEHPLPVDLDKWIEPGKKSLGGADKKFTAMGHGDASWAAYYDNVVNRLAFYDDLQGVGSGPLAYLVCGWFADPADDPLGQKWVKSLNDFYRRLDELNWKLHDHELENVVASSRDYIRAAASIGLETLEATTRFVSSASSSAQRTPPAVGSEPAPLDADGHPIGGEYSSDGSWWPSSSIYHGSVVGLGWPGLGWPGRESGILSEETGGPPPSSEVSVAVGNTQTEALAGLVAAANHAPEEATLLEAFLLGALGEVEQPDGHVRIDARLHASSFGSLPGGEVMETVWEPPVSTPAQLPKNPVVTGKSVFPHGSSSFDLVGVSEASAVSPALQAAAAAMAAPAKPVVLESKLVAASGKLEHAMQSVLGSAAMPRQARPGRWVDVARPLPRKYIPADPVLLVQGVRRSFKHGQDSRFAPDGKLYTRLTGFCLTAVACSSITGKEIRPEISGDDVLERGIENGSVPPECEQLLRETVVHDPGSSLAAAGATLPGRPAESAVQSVANRFAVEQTAWWAIRDPRSDHAALIAKSGLAGTLPSPIAVTPPVRPWTPLHLEWSVQFLPSPGGYRDWSLTELDYDPSPETLPPSGDTTSGILLRGRSLLTDGAAANVGRAIRQAIADAARSGAAAELKPGKTIRLPSQFALETMTTVRSLTEKSRFVSAAATAMSPSPVDRSGLADIASTLENMDVLAGSIEHFDTGLRGGLVADGVTVPKEGDPPPSPFLAVRSGFLRVLRLRVVDCFGQFVDLAGSGATSLADPDRLLLSEPLRVPARNDIAALPPRFTSPARLWLRLMDGGGADKEAGAGTSPVCGYVLPDHLDGALEFFDADGASRGQLRPDENAGLLWEEAPGLPTTVGQSPARAIPNAFLAGFAQSLLEWGIADRAASTPREDTLSSLLRVIDSTLWSIDPYAHTGDEHLALLVGHPIAVLRGRLLLEISEPVAKDEVARVRVPLRLGSLAHWQDGLFGFFVNDDYRTFYCTDAAAAGMAREIGPWRGFLQNINKTADFYANFAKDLPDNAASGDSPVLHPYTDTSGFAWIMPNQEVALTLLVEPHSLIHATPGLLPRKEIALLRNWTAEALKKLSPTFRFGPVLVDPKRIRMPVAGEAHGSWSWSHRTDVTRWADDPVVNSTSDANLPQDAVRGSEGWLKLTPVEEESQ